MSSLSIGFKRKREEVSVTPQAAQPVMMAAGLRVDTPTPTYIYDTTNNIIATVPGAILDSQFRDRLDIGRIIGGTATKSLGNSAFTSCNLLQSIDFSSVNSIGTSVFANCYSLASINLPLFSNAGTGVFSGCTNIQSINLPQLNAVTGNMFFGCFNLQSINIPKATIINANAFDGGCNLTGTLTLPNVLEINSLALYNNANLTTLKLNAPRVGVQTNCLAGTGVTTIRLRPAPYTPAGWTLGPGQTIGAKSGITVVADWTDYPN